MNSGDLWGVRGFWGKKKESVLKTKPNVTYEGPKASPNSPPIGRASNPTLLLLGGYALKNTPSYQGAFAPNKTTWIYAQDMSVDTAAAEHADCDTFRILALILLFANYFVDFLIFIVLHLCATL